MIDVLVSLLINPWLGIADRPEDLHAEKMRVIEQRLAISKTPRTPDAVALNFSPPPKAPLPVIDGRLLEQSLKGDRVAAHNVESGMAKWTMTGLIGAGSRRVAILNDGLRDQVVATGAVIDRQWRVEKVDAGRVVLFPLARGEGNRSVTLYLNAPTPNEE